MDVPHSVFSWIALGGALALLGAAVLTATGRAGSHLWLDRAILAQLATMAVAALSGIAFPVGGRLPTDSLHFVYALVGLVVTPVVRYATREGDDRRQGRWQALAAAIALGAVLRLFMTGR